MPATDVASTLSQLPHGQVNPTLCPEPERRRADATLQRF